MAQLASRPSLDATTIDLGPARRPPPQLQPHPPTPQKAGAQPKLHPLLLPALTLGVVLAVALAFGFATPTDKELSGAPVWGRLSNIIGWAYFAMWSISFYPQMWENYKRKSVNGLSFDYELYNLVGFACYSIFNCAFFWSREIQEAYRQTHGGHANAVQANDVFFSLHAVVITVIVIGQIFVYDRSPKISALCKAFFFTTLLMVLVYLWGTAFGRRDLCSCFTWLSLLYLLSYIKLAITIFKYIPQVVLNYNRRSTVGWSIGNVLLDGGGGLLSLGQLFGDAAVKNDWSAVTGDPVKFGLGFVSLLFDAIFAVQHYVLYPEREHAGSELEESDAEKPLLSEDHGAQEQA